MRAVLTLVLVLIESVVVFAAKENGAMRWPLGETEIPGEVAGDFTGDCDLWDDTTRVKAALLSARRIFPLVTPGRCRMAVA